MKPARLVSIAIVVAFPCVGIPALAATPSSFDLICSGKSTTIDGSAKPFSMRLSVDRSRKLWCYRDVGCPHVFPIISVQARKITFLAVKTERNEASLAVNLNGGAFTRTSLIPSRPASESSATGVCQVSSYSPIK